MSTAEWNRLSRGLLGRHRGTRQLRIARDIDKDTDIIPTRSGRGIGNATLDPFTVAYLECALWSSHDESDPSGGEPLDKNYTLDDFAPEALGRAIADCRVFQEANADDIYNADYAPGSGEWSNAERAGHDFWLTRNGHGAGFWDRGLREIGERLDKAATAAGPCDAYLGDDRRIYFA